MSKSGNTIQLLQMLPAYFSTPIVKFDIAHSFYQTQWLFTLLFHLSLLLTTKNLIYLL